MRKRWFTLVNGESLSDVETFTKTLKGLGKIYTMRVHYENTNGATSNTLGHLHDQVTKLQITNGSRVLHSLSMSEEMAVNCYRRGKFPFHFLSQDAAAVVKEDCSIDFWLGQDDDDHYLDTDVYAAPLLSFTNGFTISATAGFATGKGTLTVEVLLADGNAPPSQGFILAKEIDTYTPGTSGVHKTELELDMPYIALMLLTGVDGKDPTAAITHLKLTFDNDAMIPYDRDIANIVRELADKYGPWSERMSPILSGTSATFKMDLYDRVSGFMDDAGATAKGIITVVAKNDLTEASTTAETAITSARADGWLPFGATYLPFGDGMDPGDFMDPTPYKTIELQQTMGEADSTQVVTLQLAKS